MHHKSPFRDQNQKFLGRGSCPEPPPPVDPTLLDASGASIAPPKNIFGLTPLFIDHAVFDVKNFVIFMHSVYLWRGNFTCFECGVSTPYYDVFIFFLIQKL